MLYVALDLFIANMHRSYLPTDFQVAESTWSNENRLNDQSGQTRLCNAYQRHGALHYMLASENETREKSRNWDIGYLVMNPR